MIWNSWEILWSSSDFLLWIWADTRFPRPRNRLWVFHGRQNAKSVNVQQTLQLTLCSLNCFPHLCTPTHRHMQYISSDTVAESRNNFNHMMPRGPNSTLFFVSSPPHSSLLSSPPSRSHVGCNYEHGCRESVVLFFWHCKMSVLVCFRRIHAVHTYTYVHRH